MVAEGVAYLPDQGNIDKIKDILILNTLFKYCNSQWS